MNSKRYVGVGCLIEMWEIVRANDYVVVQLLGSSLYTGDWSFCVTVRDGTSDGWVLGDTSAIPFLTPQTVETSTGFTNFPEGACFKGASDYLVGLGLLPGSL